MIHLGLCQSASELAKNNRRIGVTLAPFGSLAVYPCSSKPQGGQVYPQDTKISIVQFNAIPESRVGFYHSLLEVYVASRAKPDPNAVQKLLLEHAQTLQSLGDSDDETALFLAMHSVWQLANALWFTPQESLLSRISHWQTMNHSGGLDTEFEHIFASISTREAPETWPFILKCLLQGHFKVAGILLDTFPEYKDPSPSNPVLALMRLLNEKPSESTASYHLKSNQLLRWREEVGFVYESGSMSSLEFVESDRDYFKAAFEILLGDEGVILDLASTWQEALLSMILYVHPNMKESNLPMVMESLGARFEPTAILDKVLWAILSLDVPLTIRHCSELDWGLVTHLVDCFDLFGMLDDQMIRELYRGDSSFPLAEWYTIAFAEYLVSSPDLWRVAIEYLAHCPSGKEVLETIISHIPLDSNVPKLLAFCRKYDLIDSGKNIFRVLGQNACSAGRIGESISWFVEAQDFDRVEQLASKLLQSSLDPDQSIKTLKIVQSLNPKVIEVSPSLSFLYSYEKFKELYAQAKMMEAGKQLILMMTSGHTPPLFYPQLLNDATPLLEGSELVFNQSDSFELMRCLEDHLSREASATYKQALSRNLNEEYDRFVSKSFEVVKLALARNLARSIVSQ